MRKTKEEGYYTRNRYALRFKSLNNLLQNNNLLNLINKLIKRDRNINLISVHCHCKCQYKNGEEER